MSVFNKILRAGEGKRVRQLAELVGPINDLAGEVGGLTDAELRAKTDVFRERLAEGETLDDLLIEAFAVVREAATRVLGQRHYDVQLMGGMALHFGWIAEMKTGEGKTLVSTLPVYLNALAGRGVHVVTVNDYLATRDADWMGQVHRFLGITVGRVGPDLADFEDKREAYACDVTYGTNTEFGFDYLRDNMARRPRAHGPARPPLRHRRRGRLDPHRRGAHAAHHLGARRRTCPSSTTSSPPSRELWCATLDYEVDEEKKTVMPRPRRASRRSSASSASPTSTTRSATNYVHQLGQALRAKELYHRDKDYLVDAGEVKIVDEFTGRTLDGRRWSDGLHQAVEAKERVRIQEENHTWATVTLQNYFRLYEKLAGMTGTAETEAGEFGSTYNLAVVPIPTNLPERARRPRRPHLQDRGRRSSRSIVEDIHERCDRGQPILVGTAVGREVRAPLAPAARQGAGSPTRSSTRSSTSARPRSWPRPVACTRSPWRPTWPGAASTSSWAATPRAWPARDALAQGLAPGTEECDAAVAAALGPLRESATGEADAVIAAGGLYVLGTERHESRRIDNQLRGRSGRQGDPGESRVLPVARGRPDAPLRDRRGQLGDGPHACPTTLPIEAKMVTKAIERAQNTVEGATPRSARTSSSTTR